MVHRNRCFRPLVAICAVLQGAYIPQFATSEEPEHHMDFAIGNSDEYADAFLSMKAPTFNSGTSVHDHERITRILASTKELVSTSSVLVQNERTMKAGLDMLERANRMFSDVKNFMRQQNERRQEQAKEDERSLLRGKYSDHDIQKTQEDEKRTLDIARAMFETFTTFPECIERLFDDCLAIINSDLASLGLSTIEVVVHEKRNSYQEGYNKVVIVTNELADRVKGRMGDGIVTYPFLWDDAVQGQRMLGVDGKWNCHELSPEDCCSSIKQSVPNPDTKGKDIECHIFVPFGGVGNPRRNDRVFINLSPDGRVHEAPVIQ